MEVFRIEPEGPVRFLIFITDRLLHAHQLDIKDQGCIRRNHATGALRSVCQLGRNNQSGFVSYS